jgi:outer membrane protein OmpA-like peptidoglycan-associated protein
MNLEVSAVAPSSRHLILVATLFMSLFGSYSAFAQTKDKPGSADHPMISRYPGSYIEAYRQVDFDESSLAVAVRDPNARKTVVLQPFEGKVTTIIYKVVGSHSVLQVFRNFEQAVQKAGLKTLFNCENASCGRGFGEALFEKTNRVAQYGTMNYVGIQPNNGELRYLSASGVLDGAPVAIGVYVTRPNNGDRTNIGIDIIESAPMKSGLVSISADSVKNDIDKTGKAILSGIYFDTDKATMKADSAAALQAIAAYLKASKGSFFVVGHTDTQGAYEYNVDLSQRRAKAVVDELQRQHGINRDRFTAVGIGPVSPAGSNQNDKDRAVNRRVELVLR